MSIGVSMAINILDYDKISDEELEQMFNEHERWLEDKTKGKKAVFNHLNLKDKDFCGRDLSEAEFINCYFYETKFSKAKLTDVKFNGGDISNTEFSKADLTGTEFSKVFMFAANFQDACLQKAIIKKSVVWISSFQRADLTDAVLESSNMPDADYEDAKLVRTKFIRVDMYGNILTNANCAGARFIDIIDEYADFEGADMTDAGFIFSEEE